VPHPGDHDHRLPDKLADQLTHRYGSNGFALYGLPVPSKGRVSGILGVNGIGKSTAVKILSGQIMPNLGKPDATWEDVYRFFAGSELQDYMRRVSRREIKTAQKPQYIDLIPKAFKGKVVDLLRKRTSVRSSTKSSKSLTLASYLAGTSASCREASCSGSPSPRAPCGRRIFISSTR